MRLASVLAVAATSLALFASDASADEKSMCSATYQSAQRLRAAGKLTLARADLLHCAEPACPAFVSNDCKTWLAEVDNEQPTLVFAVFDSNGGDVPNAVIRIDGAEVASATDGLGHAIDPGGHLIEASSGGRSLRQRIVVRVGEKSRRIELRLPIAPVPFNETTSSSSRVPIGAYVLGGVAVAGIAAGSLLWITGSNAAKTYNADCVSTGCTQSQRVSAARQLVIGDLAWAGGLAAGIGAVVLVLGHHDSATATVSLGLSSVSLVGSF